jgi:hypothetical protein
MFFFSTQYKSSIINEFSNKVNLCNHKILNLIQGDISKLSFLNFKIKKQHKKKLKNLLILELLGLQKSFLKNNINKTVKKTIYKPVKVVNYLLKKNSNYYLYNFSKINLGSMHTLLKYGLSINLEQKEITLKTSFDIIYKNSRYFSNLLDLNYEKSYHYYKQNAYHSLVLLSFYKKSL